MRIPITQNTINKLNKIFGVEFIFTESYSGYDYYIAEVVNPLPHLFKDIKIEIQWNTLNLTGTVWYRYTHPSSATNGYNLGFIQNEEFTHIKTMI